MTTIKDIDGNIIEVTDLNAAIDECKRCKDSPYKMESGHTVGENYAYMLEQLLPLQQQSRRSRWLEGTEMRYNQGKRFTKMDIALSLIHI